MLHGAEIHQISHQSAERLWEGDFRPILKQSESSD